MSRDGIEARYQRGMKRKDTKDENQGRVSTKVLRRMGYQGTIPRKDIEAGYQRRMKSSDTKDGNQA